MLPGLVTVPSTGMEALGGEAGEEVELVSGEEADLDPAEDVIHDRLGVADLLVAGPAGGLEAGVGELLAEDARAARRAGGRARPQSRRSP